MNKDYQDGYRNADGPFRDMFAVGQKKVGQDQADQDAAWRNRTNRGGLAANLISISVLAVVVSILAHVMAPDTGAGASGSTPVPVGAQIAISLPVVGVTGFVIAGLLLPVFALTRLMKLRVKGRMKPVWLRSGLALAVSVTPLVTATILCMNVIARAESPGAAVPGDLASAGASLSVGIMAVLTGQDLSQSYVIPPSPAIATMVMVGMIIIAPFCCGAGLLAPAFHRHARWVAAPAVLGLHIAALLSVFAVAVGLTS